jgi:hypothetical protein
VTERNPYASSQVPVAEAPGRARRAVVMLATALFGILPATLELLANALFSWSASGAELPEGIVMVVRWYQVVETLLIMSGILIGYVALFFAAGGRVNGRVAVALSIGAIAMAYAAAFGSASWFALPAVVAAVHAAYFLFSRRRRVQEHAQGAA